MRVLKKIAVLLCLCFSFWTVFSKDTDQGVSVQVVELGGNNEWKFLKKNWKYFPGKLLSPTETIGVPYVNPHFPFHRRDPNGKPACATYQIDLIVRNNGQQISVFFPIIASAYQIWVNDEVVAKKGLLTCIPEAERKGVMEEVVVNLPVSQTRVQLTVQVSNFHDYYYSGILLFPRIGNTKEGLRKNYVSKAVSNIFIGCITGLVFLNFILFCFYRHNKEYLWLTLICLCIAVRAAVVNVGSNLLIDLQPEISIVLIKKIEFLSVYSILIFFPLYIYSMCKGNCSRKLMAIGSFVGACFVGFTIFSPLLWVRDILDVANVFFIIELLYFLFILFKRKGRGGVNMYIVVGLILCIPILINGILLSTGSTFVLYNYPNQIEFGLLLFCLSQTFVLAKDNARMFRRINELNSSLDQEVEARTTKLAESINAREVLLSTISHDLRAPMHSLHGLLSLFNNDRLSADEFRKLSLTVAEQLKSNEFLMDTLLAWAKAQSNGIKINLTKVNLHTLVIQCVDILGYALKKKNLTIENEVKEGTYVWADADVIKLVLRNLLSNSIKFSDPGKNIVIAVSGANEGVELRVRDNGTGMDKQQIKSILEERKGTSTLGTLNEKGHGLGLPLCVRFLSEMGTTLRINSEPGSGSSFHIPLKVAN